MRRREFLQTAGAAGLSASLGHAACAAPPIAATSSQSADKSLAVRRTDSDRFEMAFSPTEPRPVRILQLTDTHFGNPDSGSQRADKRSFGEIRRLVESHRPDLLVHTGDFINNDKGAGISFEAVDFFDDLNVPWTHVLGNHDIGAVSVPDFRRKMKNAAVGEFQTGGQPHYAFRFDLVSAAGGEPKFSIYGFNSGFTKPVKHVGREQVEWFEGQMRRDADQGIKCPSLAMIHIPVVEFEKLRAAQRYAGNFGESICFETDGGDAFAAFRRSGRLKGVFSGHDHRNDFQGNWEGVELVYGRVSGWTAYGELPRGGRLIEIDLAAQSYKHHLVLPSTQPTHAMKLAKIRQPDGIQAVAVVDGDFVTPLPATREHASLFDILQATDPAAAVRKLMVGAGSRQNIASVALLAPIDRQEVWAAGVTYRRSQVARMEESQGAASFYDKVYVAERPELFFKATPHRVVGPGGAVRIRQDARWNVPEPELALVLNSRLELVGYCVGNDMSSRDIEGENPLYLPQAKLYDGSCALGPWVTFAEAMPPAVDVEIGLLIERDGRKAFEGATSVGQMARTFDDLIGWLGRDNSFPDGVVLLTGTGIVPDDSFTLAPGDTIWISISGIGTLVNSVVQGSSR